MLFIHISQEFSMLKSFLLHFLFVPLTYFLNGLKDWIEYTFGNSCAWALTYIGNM